MTSTTAARLRERLANRVREEEQDPSLVWAAVALILAPDPDSILLIRRADRSGDPWSGHMALPGGRRDPGDPDLLSTAIRETEEEVGVTLGSEHLAGLLEDVIPRLPTLPPIAVRPFVFLLRDRPKLKPNSEVAAATWVSLDHLARPGNRHPVLLDVAGESRMVTAYQLENGVVWGMTERILTNLLAKLLP